MRKLALTLIILAAACLIWASCNTIPPSHSLVYMVDLTEEYYRPTTFELLQSLSITIQDGNAREEITIRPITELTFNQAHAFILPALQNELLGNELDRNRELKRYYSNIQTTLDTLSMQAAKRERSVIYEPMMQELTRLANSKAEHKTLSLQSDLMELSGLANFYKSQTLQQLRDKPELLREVFEAKYPLPNLNGITVYLIHQPVSPEDNDRYSIISAFYKGILEEHGATVHISANLSIAQTLMPWKP